jgi:PhnB protein
MAAKFQPDGYHTLTPFFQVEDADAFMTFVTAVFSAEETEVIRRPDGRVGHAELRIGDSLLMLAEGDRMPIAVYVYLPDVDSVYARALGAGATASSEPADQFWGDRQGAFRDAWGNMWFVATHREDVPVAELQRQMEAQAH